MLMLFASDHLLKPDNPKRCDRRDLALNAIQFNK